MHIPLITLRGDRKRVKGRKRHAVLVVKFEDREVEFPATQLGAYEAGEAMFAHNPKQHEIGMLFSSSCNHSNDYGLPAIDIPSLFNQGYDERLYDAQAPKRAVIAKIFAMCDQTDFQGGLSEPEQVAYGELKAFFKLDQKGTEVTSCPSESKPGVRPPKNSAGSTRTKSVGSRNTSRASTSTRAS